MIAVLLSGGLDSAVLVADEARHDAVQPIYVSVGLGWEVDEQESARSFLAAGLFAHPVHPLVSLSVDMSDVYPAAHWARAGRPPGYHTSDEDVYLPGRNIVLLAKAAVFSAAAGIKRLAIGTLAHNPFPDATPEFRAALGSALSLGLAWNLDIVAPYAAVDKAEVIRRGHAAGLPLQLTLSCMKPSGAVDGRPLHCGLCSKCRERHEAFVSAGVLDKTLYADNRYTAQP
jgi:7-cyano-7-deazaguanine synthase